MLDLVSRLQRQVDVADEEAADEIAAAFGPLVRIVGAQGGLARIHPPELLPDDRPAQALALSTLASS